MAWFPLYLGDKKKRKEKKKYEREKYVESWIKLTARNRVKRNLFISQ